MKKTTIYKLLCTMVMVPGVSLATEQPSTPLSQRSAELKRRVVDDLPATPQLKNEVNSRIDRSIVTAPRARLLEASGLKAAREQRDQEKRTRFAEIDRQIDQERLARERTRHEERARAQTSQYEELIQRATEETRQKQLQSEMLQSTIRDLEGRIGRLTAEFDETRDVLNLTAEFSEQNVEEISQKSRELDEAKDQLERLRTNEGLLKIQLEMAQASEEFLKGVIHRMSSSSQPSSSSSSLNSMVGNGLVPRSASSHSAQSTPPRQNATVAPSANVSAQEGQIDDTL